MLRPLLLSFCLLLSSGLASAFSLPTYVTVVEYYNKYLDHYFLTATPDEMAAIEAGSAGAGWYRTGYTFEAYAVNGGFGDRPVARFYGTPGLGPNSHFYTADPKEAAGINVPGSGWTFERDEFVIDVPSGSDGQGQCAAGAVPVYRLYNNRWMFNDSNHRYVTDAGERAKMQAKGWIDEGVRFCALGASQGPLKSHLISIDLGLKTKPSAQCEDETLNRGPCMALNNLPVPAFKWLSMTFGDVPASFSSETGLASSQVFFNLDSLTSGPWHDAFVSGGANLLGIHVSTVRRGPNDLSSVNPLYQFHTTLVGPYDDRFFPWTGYGVDTEIRLSFDLFVKTVDVWSAGSQAYGHPTVEFIDTRSGHHLYFTLGTYSTMSLDGGDYRSIDAGTGTVIVGTPLLPSTPYGRGMALSALPTPAPFVSPNPDGTGGHFEFRMNRDEFQRLVDAARTLDGALSAQPDDYIIDNFHFNNEVYRDGEIGLNLHDYKLELWKR